MADLLLFNLIINHIRRDLGFNIRRMILPSSIF
jgi:hypothetical protein